MAGTVLVLGAGLQGRATLEDLEKRSSVEKIIAADCDTAAAKQYLSSIGARRTEVRGLDARDGKALRALLSGGADVVINMLPVTFRDAVIRAAIEAGVHFVSTNYAHEQRELDGRAAERGVTIMPEAGLDPGIDLVMAGRAVAVFDRIESMLSYGSGVPAPECRDTNPLRYKISWNFEGVLQSYWRSARVLVDGEEFRAGPHEIFEPAWTHHVSFGEFGPMESFVNGDAVAFAEMLGIRDSVRTMGRYACRWPGHCEFWRKVSALGLLDEAAPPGGGGSPREFLRRHLEPRLQYAEGERDMVLLRVEVLGTIGGERAARRWEMVDYRDLASGLMAMNRTVGYPASIIAEMIMNGQVTRRGVCSPVRDVPPGLARPVGAD